MVSYKNTLNNFSETVFNVLQDEPLQTLLYYGCKIPASSCFSKCDCERGGFGVFTRILYLQTLKTRMEKQEREHHESSADVTAKHSQELKDLGKKGISAGESRDGESMLLQSVSLNCLSINHSQSCPTARS